MLYILGCVRLNALSEVVSGDCPCLKLDIVLL